MFFVKPLVAFGGHHHLNLRHGIGPGTAGLGNTNVRDVAALTAGGKDGELVVLALVKSEVIKTPGRDAAGAVKGTHVGPAQGLVAGNDGGDVVIAQYEIADDAVGFLSFGQLIGIARTDLESFHGGLGGKGHGKQE